MMMVETYLICGLNEPGQNKFMIKIIDAIAKVSRSKRESDLSVK